MARKKRVTIKQVAREAGVSAQTVSRVINERPDVAEETRRRVLQVIDQLGYQPSYVARSLIQGRSCTLGVVGTGIEYFGPSRTLAGIEGKAYELGYALLFRLIHQPENDSAQQALRDLLSHHVDGVIWAVPEIGSNHDWIPELIEGLSVPIVFLSMQPTPNLTVIAVDNRSGGRLAARHLIDCGYRRIGLIAGPLEWWEARERQLGWREALSGAGLPADSDLVVEGDWTAASGERCLLRLLERHPDIEAVFVSNDQMALGALKASRSLGLEVPRDLAIVGFDDIPEAAYFCPALTTVRQDMIELGARAMLELHRIIQASQQGAPKQQGAALLLQPQLVVRESSGCPCS